MMVFTKRRLTLIAGVLVGGGAIVLAALAYMALGPGPSDFGGPTVALDQYHGPAPTGVPASLAKADLVTRGEYLAKAADCAACHTVKGGKPFAGGRPFKLPFGTLYTPNITPDRQTGIGQYTDAQFLRAVHKGVARDGKRLYPAFPYAAYTAMPDADVLAIKAYLFVQAPVRQTAPANTLAFPFNQRFLMAIWGLLFNPDQRFRPAPSQGPQWNRGAYLVEAAAHCGDCHSPRNLMQAVDNRHKFAGGAAEGWNAYNITSDRRSGVGEWSPGELKAYLSTGHAAGRGTASGPMREAVELSLSHLTSDDVDAMVAYLRSVPPINTRDLPQPAGPAPAAPKAGFGPDAPGKKIFEQACASCHAWDGSGAMRREAQLTGDRAVNDPSATNVAQMVLNGAGRAGGPRPYMPAFAETYTDRDIADVANYVTARFGAKPSKVTAKGVAKMREQN